MNEVYSAPYFSCYNVVPTLSSSCAGFIDSAQVYPYSLLRVCQALYVQNVVAMSCITVMYYIDWLPRQFLDCMCVFDLPLGDVCYYAIIAVRKKGEERDDASGEWNRKRRHRLSKRAEGRTTCTAHCAHL